MDNIYIYIYIYIYTHKHTACRGASVCIFCPIRPQITKITFEGKVFIVHATIDEVSSIWNHRNL